MDRFFFFFFLISFFLISPPILASSILNCPPLKCPHSSSLTIQYPFRIQNQHPQQCGRSGFDLNCSKNRTTLHLPSYGDLVVKSISYDTQSVDLLDPKNCVHEVFLNLNLSDTPFSYYYDLKKYKYLKCFADQLPTRNYIQVPCLSDSGFHFYVAETYERVPVFCQHVKTAEIPFEYSPYLNDNSFGLRFTWEITGSDEDGQHRPFFKIACLRVLLVAMFILLMIAMVLYHLMASMSKKLSSEVEIEMDNDVRVDELLGQYQAI